MTTNDKFSEAAHLQALEGNPLDARDLAMFEEFERDGVPAEQRRAEIFAQVTSTVPVAE